MDARLRKDFSSGIYALAILLDGVADAVKGLRGSSAAVIRSLDPPDKRDA
jgi:hypothetical protein